MYCEIYPIKRLPRRFAFFDYRIPDGMHVQPGDFVRISFRRQNCFGIVRRTMSTSTFKRLADVQGVVVSKLLTEKSIQRFETIANLVAQSPSTLLHFAYGDLNARKKLPAIHQPKNQLNGTLHPQQIEPLRLAAQWQAGSHYLQSSSEEMIALMTGLSKKPGQLLVLCPDARMAEQFASSPLESHALLTGRTKKPEREAMILAWQRGEIKTLIGTRLTSLIAPHDLRHVIIVDSANDDYRFLDRNPRFDARMAAEALAYEHNATCYFAGPFPLAHLYQENQFSTAIDPTIIPMGAEGEGTGISFLSKQLRQAIVAMPQNGKALLFFNRKGLLEKGIGNQQLCAAFREQFPNKTIGIVDKDQQQISADIWLTTEYFFKSIWTPFHPKQFSVIAELHFEQQLNDRSFHAAEYAGFALHRLIRFAKQQQAECYIQIWEKDSAHSLLSAESWLKQELAMRKRYHLPPYGYYAEKQKKDDETAQIIRATDENLEKTLQDLKKLPDSAIVSAETIYVSPNRFNPSE